MASFQITDTTPSEKLSLKIDSTSVLAIGPSALRNTSHLAPRASVLLPPRDYPILQLFTTCIARLVNVPQRVSSQIKPESYTDGKSTSRSFSITQHPRTPHSHHCLPPRRKPTPVTLTRPLWRRCALPSDSYAITEPLERTASQRRFIRRALTPWAHGCIG